MKKFFLIVLSIVCFLGAVDANAQKGAKLGHVDSEALFEMMPERDSIATALQNFYATLEKQLMAMQQEYQPKIADLQQNQNSMTDLIRETKVREIADLETRIQEFQALAQQRLSEKQMELTQPIIDKIKNAVASVAKENGYSYIFDYSATNVQSILYAEPSDDVMPLVKAKLGL